MSLLDLGTVLGMAPAELVLYQSSILEMSATLGAQRTGGIVFDYYGPEDFKFAAMKADTNQVVIGHHTRRGWTIDTTASKTIGSGVDHILAVTLKGTTVSVTLDGQAVLGHVFNALVVDGKVRPVHAGRRFVLRRPDRQDR